MLPTKLSLHVPIRRKDKCLQNQSVSKSQQYVMSWKRSIGVKMFVLKYIIPGEKKSGPNVRSFFNCSLFDAHISVPTREMRFKNRVQKQISIEKFA